MFACCQSKIYISRFVFDIYQIEYGLDEFRMGDESCPMILGKK